MSPVMRRIVLFVLATVAALAGYWTAQLLRPAALPVAGNDLQPLDMLFPPGSSQESLPQNVEFTLPDLNGQMQASSQWRGKLLIVNFWATWCPPCREEIPLFVEFQRTHGAKGVQIVGVAIDERDEVLEFQRRQPLNYPQLLGENTGLDLIAKFGNRMGSLPFTVVIGPDGSIISRKVGAYRRPELEGLLVHLPANISATTAR